MLCSAKWRKCSLRICYGKNLYEFCSVIYYSLTCVFRHARGYYNSYNPRKNFLFLPGGLYICVSQINSNSHFYLIGSMMRDHPLTPGKQLVVFFKRPHILLNKWQDCKLAILVLSGNLYQLLQQQYTKSIALSPPPWDKDQHVISCALLFHRQTIPFELDYCLAAEWSSLAGFKGCSLKNFCFWLKSNLLSRQVAIETAKSKFIYLHSLQKILFCS